MSKRKARRIRQGELPKIQVDAWHDDNGKHFVTLTTNFSPLPLVWQVNSAADAEKWRDEVFE